MTNPLTALLFVSLTALAVGASLHSWRTKLAYGWFRFLAFEVLAVLVIWNAGRWFHDPLSNRQIVSWALLVASAALAIHGIHLLRAIGRSRKRIMEDTQAVVEAGAYRYIRHPLYASLLLLGWGAFFKGTDLPSGVLAVVVSALLFLTARYEERFNVARFGASYSEYMRRTKMFIPFVL